MGKRLELSYSDGVIGKIKVGPVDLRRGTNTVTIVVTAPEKGSLSRIALQELSVEK